MTDRRSAGRRDDGATAVEYAIMLALIAAVIFSAVWALGQTTLANFVTGEGLFP